MHISSNPGLRILFFVITFFLCNKQCLNFHVDNLCACLLFCIRKVYLIILLQVYIKDSLFSVLKPQVSGKSPWFEHIQKRKIKYGNELIQQNCDIHNQRPFFVYQMKIP